MPLRRWTINFMPRFTKWIVSHKKLKWKSIFGIVYVAFYVHIAFLLQLTRYSWAHSENLMAFKISSKENRQKGASDGTFWGHLNLWDLKKFLRWQEHSNQPQITKLSSSITTFRRLNFGNSIQPPRVEFYDWSLMLWIT